MMAITNKNQKTNYLNWMDIIILTIIFWGDSIINSTRAHIEMLNIDLIGSDFEVV
ncbi:MAG: hypothetical protein SPI53_05195 [Erysipelotrichaceae bacterium]|nr:hypothetical protein [Erysipelotrichaceae bacterium]